MPRFKQGTELAEKAVRKIEHRNKEGIAEVQPEKVNSTHNKEQITSDKAIEIKATSYVEGGCDELIKKDGTIIQAKIFEIGTSQIKYKKGDNKEGPTYVISKSDVFMIKFANGSTELINTIEEKEEINNEEDYIPFDFTDENSNQSPIRKKGEPNALISFILSCLAFVITMIANVGVGFVIAVPALILSIIGLSRQSKYKERYKRPGFALPAIIITGVTILIALAYIALLY